MAATLAVWFFWPDVEGPQLIAGSVSVSYDPEAKRLSALVTLQNSGDRPIVASITNDVFVDSQKQRLNDPRRPSRIEFGSKQANPVTFILQGDTAADAWNGVRLMEITIDAVYNGDAKLTCHFSVMGRFFPQLKQIGIVSSVTSPRACRGR